MIDDDKSPRSRMTRAPALDAHRTAVANTVTWAEESAARGDYVNALSWLNVDAISETLPGADELKRLDWRRALIGQRVPQCSG